MRTELGIPPAHMLLMELREEVRDRLEDTSSRAWRRRLRFKEPGFGTIEAGIPLATKGSSRDCPLSPLPRRLLLLSCPLVKFSSSSSIMALFLLSLRALMMDSLAQGSRASLGVNEKEPGEERCSNSGERPMWLSGRAIFTVTGLWTGLEWQVESWIFR